jgi:hypothetical protein
MQAEWDLPDEQAYICEQKHGSDDGKHDPHGVDHHKTGSQDAGHDCDSLHAGRDEVDLFDGVGSVFSRFILEPESHLAADVRRALEAGGKRQ